MDGIATIDRQGVSDTVVVWLTKLIEPLRADHTNAVSIDFTSDEKASEKVHSLTRGCAVLATPGSDLDGLPLDTSEDIEALVAATKEHQAAILDAIGAYKKRTRSMNLKEPEFPKTPVAQDFTAIDDSPSQRTLSLANFAARAWTVWLKTDEERRRRTVHPSTGKSPWVMPEGLDSLRVEVLPNVLADRVHVQA